jgi:hypothetical protein
MTYYIGLVALLLGAFYIWRSARHRKLVISARERADANGGRRETDPTWTAMGMSFMPFFLFYGAFAALLLVGGYFLSDLKTYISLFDVFGLLTLIAAYTGWIVIRTHYNKLGLDFANG